MFTLRASLACFVGSSLLMFTGCGSSSPSSGSGGGGPIVSPTASYIYSLQLTSPETVLRFTAATGGSLTPSATTTLPTGFTALDIKVDSSSNLYVAGTTSSAVREILVYTSGGTTPTRTLTVSDMGPIAVDSAGNLYMAGEFSNTVYVYSASANGTATPTRAFTYTSQYEEVEDIALDSSNNLYVDITNTYTDVGQVLEFNSSASGASTATRTLVLTGYTYGIGVDSSGDIYVSSNVVTGSSATGTIEVFGASGTSPTRTITPNVGAINIVGGVKADSVGYAYAVVGTVASALSTTATYSLVSMAPSQSGTVTPTDVATSSSLVNTNYQIAVK